MARVPSPTSLEKAPAHSPMCLERLFSDGPWAAFRGSPCFICIRDAKAMLLRLSNVGRFGRTCSVKALDERLSHRLAQPAAALGPYYRRHRLDRRELSL